MLEIKDLHVSYGGIQALRGVSLNVPDGKIVTLIGANGAGKSTLMRTISGLVKAQSGSILWNGQELLGKPIDQIVASGIAMSPEGRRVFADLTVLENVELPLVYQGVSADDRREMALAALERVGLAERVKHRPTQMSGGQQQRVAIARAIAANPSIVMADEPTGALDSRTGREALGFLQKLNAEGDTVVLITHDNSIAVKAKRIVRLQDGSIIYDGDAKAPEAVVRPAESGEEAGA